MNWIDLAFLGLFAFALHLGFQKGFVRQVATLAGLVLGIALAGKYHVELARSSYLAGVLRECGESTTMLATYLGIFAAAILGAQLLATIVRHAIKGKLAEPIDSVLGGILGLAKVCALCGAAAIGVLQFLPADGIRQHFAESYFAPRLASCVNQALERVPSDCRDEVMEFLRRGAPHPRAVPPASEQIADATRPGAGRRSAPGVPAARASMGRTKS